MGPHQPGLNRNLGCLGDPNSPAQGLPASVSTGGPEHCVLSTHTVLCPLWSCLGCHLSLPPLPHPPPPSTSTRMKTRHPQILQVRKMGDPHEGTGGLRLRGP